MKRTGSEVAADDDDTAGGDSGNGYGVDDMDSSGHPEGDDDMAGDSGNETGVDMDSSGHQLLLILSLSTALFPGSGSPPPAATIILARSSSSWLFLTIIAAAAGTDIEFCSSPLRLFDFFFLVDKSK